MSTIVVYSFSKNKWKIAEVFHILKNDKAATAIHGGFK
jgi:hypothetical protein